jgi:hypothetical protein
VVRVARSGARSVSVTLYLTPDEVALLEAVRSARAVELREESRADLLVRLLCAESERLQEAPAMPARVEDALWAARRAVESAPRPAKRMGRPPVVQRAAPAAGTVQTTGGFSPA